jgi:hypothetical protein
LGQVPQQTYVFPLRLHVIGNDPETERWFSEQLLDANARFAPVGVQFVVAERRRLSPRYERVSTFRDVLPLALGEADDRTAIDVFLVSAVPHGTASHCGGLVLRPGWGNPPIHQSSLVLITQASWPVLAHQLAHYFGVPDSRRIGDAMFPATTTDDEFELEEIRRMRAGAETAAVAGSPPVLPRL